jgi:hypothetical protein
LGIIARHRGELLILGSDPPIEFVAFGKHIPHLAIIVSGVAGPATARIRRGIELPGRH